MMISENLSKIVDFKDLTIKEAQETMELIMEGKVPDPQIAAFLTASRMKEISVEELTGFLQVMKNKVSSINYSRSEPILDVCGTGGAKFKTFNASTTSAFVLAAQGVTVAKHGNRSFTSKCGSADILEAIGFNINLDRDIAENMLNKHQITFLFAPNYHPAMKYVANVRKALGIRTVFNMLGPLTNPVGVKRQFIGVFDENLVLAFLKVFQNCNYESAMAVHGEIGADELVTCGKTIIGRLTNDGITMSEVTPEILGLKKVKPGELRNLPPNEAARKMIQIYQGEKDSFSDFVIANSAAGFLTAEIVDTIQEGVEMASSVLESGKPLDLVETVIKESGGNLELYNELIR